MVDDASQHSRGPGSLAKDSVATQATQGGMMPLAPLPGSLTPSTVPPTGTARTSHAEQVMAWWTCILQCLICNSWCHVMREVHRCARGCGAVDRPHL